ncbi:hypothetical protein INT45_007662 [Circinella minor]|uniref:RNI-like protein n=1 Tax=Circinella minor TaxID=1195481 RepID=A0A8H7RYJ4_9FUNG|nr:hypothetical protein INT45_007662 [Circinella minor]
MQVQDTLTRLDINITGIQHELITIPSILSFCNNLTDLVFCSKAEPLDMNLKNFTKQIKHYPSLVNLELISFHINGNDIVPIIQRCQQLRRLVLSGCDSSVLEALVRTSTPNLELFSYNDGIDGSPLPMLQEKKATANNDSYNKTEYQQQEHQNQQGLRVLYTSYGETSVRPENLIPLIYKNRKTLENVRACMSHITNTQLEYLYEKYPDFKLENIKHLSTWLSPGIQQFMLRKVIQNSNTLSTLVAVGDYNINLLLKALINRAPLLGFNISHVYDSTNDVTQLLIQLFGQYAKYSKSDRPDASLNWVKLRYCNQVTNDVLKKLSGIKTLHDIHLGGLNHISNDALLQLINKLGNQITHIFLHDMNLVNDDIIIALGDLDNLLLVKLEILNNVTDKGARALVDNKKRKLRRLTTLEITECPLISQECISYAQKNVKTVRYNSPISEYYVTKAKDTHYVSRSFWYDRL